jgi:hypothetical protein
MPLMSFVSGRRRHRQRGGIAGAGARARAGALRAPGAVGIALVALAVLTSCAGTDGNNFQEPRFTTQSGIIEGFVLDLATNPPAPVVGSRVYTVPVGGTAITTIAGFFRIDPILAGPYEVKVARDAGQTASVRVDVAPGRTARADINFNPQPVNVGRELFFITDTGTGGQIAHVIAGGVFDPAQFDLVATPGVGGQFRSLKASKASVNELLVLSNFEHPENPAVFEVYLLRLSGFLATVTRVTNDNNPKDGADLSPDGNQIVLSQDTDANGRFEIWILNRDGSNARQFIGDLEPRSGAAFDNRAPSWSAETSAIAFTSRRVDRAATVDERDFDVLHAVVSEGPLVPIPGPIATLPRIPLVPLTDDLIDDFTPAWTDRDVTITFAKGQVGRRQIFSAPGDDGGSPTTQYTNTTFDNYAAVQSNDRQLLAWVSTDDFDRSNPDHSAEITVARLVGDRLSEIRQVTRTPSTPPFVYDSVAWRLR